MRRCQRLGCENPIRRGARASVRYCGPTCKREAARSRDLSDGTASAAFWDGYARLRRLRRGTARHTTRSAARRAA